MGKVTATEEEVYKWFYETVENVDGVRPEPYEFVVEYFEMNTGLVLPPKWSQEEDTEE